MAKDCPQHGQFRVLLSDCPAYYQRLDEFYFSLMTQSFPQRDYIVYLTNRCNLSCPICLANSNMRGIRDLSPEALKAFLNGKRNLKIDLMGAEPTMREDLAEIVRIIRKSGNAAALHTNGIKIAEPSYLKRLRDSGLDEVHLQFDGFTDRIYQEIRGEKLLEIKLKALENLGRLNIPTDLKVTVVRGINDNQMAKIIDFGTRCAFVKEIFFLGCRYLGRARGLPMERCLMPDELIGLLEAQTCGKISRENVFMFQRLYFSLLAAFSIRKCFYNQHFLIMRDRDGYATADEIFDLPAIQGSLDRFREMIRVNKRTALAYLIFSLSAKFINPKRLSSLKDILPAALSFMRGFRLSQLSKRSILLGFITACDSHSFDYAVAQNCGKGAVSPDLGIQDIGAMDNVLRDGPAAFAKG